MYRWTFKKREKGILERRERKRKRALRLDGTKCCENRNNVQVPMQDAVNHNETVCRT